MNDFVQRSAAALYAAAQESQEDLLSPAEALLQQESLW